MGMFQTRNQTVSDTENCCLPLPISESISAELSFLRRLCTKNPRTALRSWISSTNKVSFRESKWIKAPEICKDVQERNGLRVLLIWISALPNITKRELDSVNGEQCW